MPIDVSRSLFIKNDAGEFVPVPMLKGEPGPAGPQGEPGPMGPKGDTDITFENITNALGYIAADDEFVQENAREISQINDSIVEISEAVEGVDDRVKILEEKPEINALRLAEDGTITVVSPPTSTKWTGNVGIGTDGKLMLANATQALINNRSTGSTQYVNLGTLDYAVKAALTDGKGAAYTAEERAAARDRIGLKDKLFIITEDMVTVTTDDTKGVAPYSTTYGYTNFEIAKDAGIKWVEGAMYVFVVDTKMVVASAYRNARIRIGGEDDGDVWHPFMMTSTVLGGNTYFVKAYNSVFYYKTVYIPEGALHLHTDANTQYAYLQNTINGDSTDSPIRIDVNGYGARYSYAFATTPLNGSDGLIIDERWSSLVASSSTGTTKKAVTPASGKFYIDRNPVYIYSANVNKDTRPTNSVYQDYYAADMRYLVNTSQTYMSRSRKCFLWLKNFDTNDMSFESDATVGNVMTLDKIGTRFPTTVTGDVYLYFLGWTTTSWYGLAPNFTQNIKIYKYTPATKKLVPWFPQQLYI